jgi:type I restriction enzyme M protein
MFFIPIIKREKHRYSYGRKCNKELLDESIMKLPVKSGNPDFDFMENYIKSISFSKFL